MRRSGPGRHSDAFRAFRRAPRATGHPGDRGTGPQPAAWRDHRGQLVPFAGRHGPLHGLCPTIEKYRSLSLLLRYVSAI